MEREIKISPMEATLEAQIVINMVRDASLALTRNPTDIAHDWEHHHQPVISNLQNIVEKGDLYGKIDLNALVVAAAWHDYMRNKDDFTELTESAKRNGASDGFIERVIGIIKEHSFGDERHSIEGELIWAADKIEYVSKVRYITSTQGMSNLKVKAYQLLWRWRMPKVMKEMERCRFKTAREMFETKKNELVDFLKEKNPMELFWFKGL